MERETGIQFKIYLMAKSRGPREEGWIRFWSNEGKRKTSAKNVAFDELNQIPAKIKAELLANGITWPKTKK